MKRLAGSSSGAVCRLHKNFLNSAESGGICRNDLFFGTTDHHELSRTRRVTR
ncbi:unnamed protein product, partial [Amoebophrya sp. A25]|eukprot:GSA25T00020432001.1